LTLLCVDGGAQQLHASLADLSLEELSNIEVTSVSKRAERLSDAAASIYVITADEIRRSARPACRRCCASLPIFTWRA